MALGVRGDRPTGSARLALTVAHPLCARLGPAPPRPTRLALPLPDKGVRGAGEPAHPVFTATCLHKDPDTKIKQARQFLTATPRRQAW